ncbi:MAG TPA: homocysteine S-methyltransferase family protein [Alphaproteobacteria bacterium]
MRMLAEALGRRLLLADAAIERQLRGVDADVARDLFGAAGCMAVLSLTRAKLVRALHEEQLRAGADLIRTNSAEASPLALRRHGLEEDAFAINYAAAQLAAGAVDAVPGEGRRRFALGRLRDGGGEAPPEEIEAAAALQASALLAGGVDGLAIEVSPHSCRAPALLRGAERARAEARSAAPILLLVPAEGPAARARTHPVIRCRELAPEEAAGRPHLLHGVELIAGRAAEHTAALDGLLREAAGEEIRPSLTAGAPSLPAPAPAPQPAPQPAPRMTGGVVLLRAARWSERRR